jgi:sugar phosphate isomerase/epimerase
MKPIENVSSSLQLNNYGVSPSYFFSAYGTDFTVEDYIEGIKTLPHLGFKSFQGEIFKPQEVENWYNKKEELYRVYKQENLTMSLFVAHFLIQSTRTLKDLKSAWGYDELKKVIEIVKTFSEVTTIVIPISPYEYNGEEYSEIHTALLNRFDTYSHIAKDADLNIALEIIPCSIIGGSDGLLRLIDSLKATNLGYNLDTGHAYCSGEVMSCLPLKLKGKIFGTHLKDNFGTDNLALPPGKGNIDFKTLLCNLQKSGYEGSLDFEIGSSKEDLFKDYKFGLAYLKSINT